MKFLSFLGLVLVLFCSKGISQNLKYCGTTEKEKELRANNPSILIDQAVLDNFVHEWIQNHKADTRDDAQYIIPLVFHIIHDYGTENISDDQVLDAVNILNEDYRKLNADTSLIVSEFKDIAADSKIEFRLANKAPDGTCTNGIEHIHSLHTYAGNDDAKLNDWPRGDYLNIWTVKNLDDGVAGYAYLPADVNGGNNAPFDGVIILSNYVGSIGTGSSTTSRALTHEIGHTLNLLHPWGLSNSPGVECGDDNIEDTPETAGWLSCNLNGSNCQLGVIENVQNFMEYSYCSKMFTTDQALAMQGALNHTTAQRNNLWTSGNLVTTGTDDTVKAICAPIADFYSATKMACTGSTITFHDISSNGPVETRTWTFQDGTPSTSADKDADVTFDSPGWKNITLDVSNSVGSNSLSRTSYVYVSDDLAQHTTGFFEGFEDPNTFTNEWIVFNPEGNGSKYSRVTNTGYLSSSCVKLNNYHNMAGDIDQLVSPSYDLSGGGPVFLNFRYSCASASGVSANINDALRVYSSTDCGQTWLLRSTTIGSALANAGFVSSSFTPTLVTHWAGKSILLPSFLYKPNVRFRFEYKTNGYGNNFYIDDINVNNYPVGIDDPEAASFELNVFPNPVTDASTISIQQKLSSNVDVKLVDQMGRIVKVVYSGWLAEGEHQFELSASDMKVSGMYYLLVDDGVTVSREKIMRQ